MMQLFFSCCLLLDAVALSIHEIRQENLLLRSSTRLTVDSSQDGQERRRAVERLELRYDQDDTISDVADSELSEPRPDCFMFRQPSIRVWPTFVIDRDSWCLPLDGIHILVIVQPLIQLFVMTISIESSVQSFPIPYSESLLLSIYTIIELHLLLPDCSSLFHPGG